MKYRHESDRVVLCSFGDGATSEGEWHESLNFAAVHRLPIVFLCENNEWAISTPLHRQMVSRDIALKADGYGIPGAIVDGSDPLAVYGVMKSAMDRARSGGGPTLVEAKCYRFLSHTTDDDDRTYRSREEIEAQRHRDPLPLYEKRLLAAGIVTQTEIAQLRKAVLAEVNRVTDEAEALPYPEPGDAYRNVYEGTHEPWL
jgi:2-oxoisovalerate dehydrogenase E1 component alpha subunit